MITLQVPNLAAIAAVTGNEVTVQHLGSRFATMAGGGILEEMKRQKPSSVYQMPTFNDTETSRQR